MFTERIVIWGTPDLGKPRARILINGLRSRNAVVAECVREIWRGIEDKSQVKGVTSWLNFAVRYCLAYPVLIFRYLLSPRHNVVIVTYMGHLDVLVLWPFAKLRGVKIVWDAFLSLYGTVVEDRKLISAKHPFARMLHFFEKLACSAADVVVLDTDAHAEYFRHRYKLRREKVISAWVGAETEIFNRRAIFPRSTDTGEFNVLFYGQFIPLHGVEHIIDAATRTSDPFIKWTIVGQGQERAKIESLVRELRLPSLKLIDWVDYHDLPELIAQSDLCLGVFGASDKAARVIPNKVFQIFALGKPLVTADTPAMREIVTEQTPGVWLVRPGSGAALAEAVAAAKRWKESGANGLLHTGIVDQISPQAIADTLTVRIENAFCNRFN